MKPPTSEGAQTIQHSRFPAFGSMPVDRPQKKAALLSATPFSHSNQPAPKPCFDVCSPPCSCSNQPTKTSFLQPVSPNPWLSARLGICELLHGLGTGSKFSPRGAKGTVASLPYQKKDT